MEVTAITRNARMSPRKVREVANTIKGRPATEAAEYLALIPRKSARLLAKTLLSAIANAENNNNLSSDSLVVKNAIVEMGPVLKRFKAGAKGSAMPRRKKMSHIRIILTDGQDTSRRPSQLAVPVVCHQEGLPRSPGRRPEDSRTSDGEAQAGRCSAHLH
jgi:large subunit ribosomal protein L22